MFQPQPNTPLKAAARMTPTHVMWSRAAQLVQTTHSSMGNHNSLLCKPLCFEVARFTAVGHWAVTIASEP